ncbi:IclR family transcriptional regulator [Methylobacterium nodulans]|uniref:Transcriptional regulator, IclR family n=1 Tax=Methylobacterium nodulans (strain LMG 21967 / CNCM I-2342 / ORS 2060) TaxID=460265 RepID=B8IUK5_METNO|nr:IclR family transcriptional regulator [Methylobacterium nodulans]ACL57073.1 transcriptional regulator, IclR family [Methylobacterium nodulans ORS 2060]
MAAGLLRRVLDLVELLAGHARGLPLQTIADSLDIPKSGAHRLLAELVSYEYVRQDPDSGRYLLTTKFATLGLKHLANSGVVDVSQSVLNRLAEQSGELVRLAVVDYPRLVWVAKAQGARSGLRYDADMGTEASLSTSSTGIVWLASLSDEEAVELVLRQGFRPPGTAGPNAPRTIPALLALVAEARARGYAWVHETHAAGTAAMAANIIHPTTGHAIGNVSIAGPSARLTEAERDRLAPDLMDAAATLSAVGPLSDYLAALSGRRARDEVRSA